jgi:serine/threonine-protein kinase RsbW
MPQQEDGKRSATPVQSGKPVEGGDGGEIADDGHGDRLVLNVTSDPANLGPVRRALESFGRRHGLTEPAVADLGLCVNEAMANVTRHAYHGQTDRPVAVTADAIDTGGETSKGGVKVTIRDWGNGVNPLSLPSRPRDLLEPGGLGLICLRQLLDEVRFETQLDGGMLLTMVKKKGSGVRNDGSAGGV